MIHPFFFMFRKKMKRGQEGSQTQNKKRQRVRNQSEISKTPTGVKYLLGIDDLKNVIRSYGNKEKIPEAQEVTNSVAVYFSPVVRYTGTGELREGVKHVIFESGIWCSLKLPSSLEKITFKSNTPLDRNLSTWRESDHDSYKTFIKKQREN